MKTLGEIVISVEVDEKGVTSTHFKYKGLENYTVLGLLDMTLRRLRQHMLSEDKKVKEDKDETNNSR